MGKVFAILAIVIGVTMVGFDPNRFDSVIFDLPRGSHGIHLHDLVGAALVAVGTLALLRVSGRGTAGDVAETDI